MIPGTMHRGRIPDQIVDLLQIDGGWLTPDGIALDLRANPETVQRALFRLRKRGEVKSRPVGGYLEWRAA